VTPRAPDRRDNTELGKVRSDRINHCGLLADEQMACAVKRPDFIDQHIGCDLVLKG